MKEFLEVVLGGLGLAGIAFGALYILQSCLDANSGFPSHTVYEELAWGFVMLTGGLLAWAWLNTRPSTPPRYDLMTTSKERKNGKKN